MSPTSVTTEQRSPAEPPVEHAGARPAVPSALPAGAPRPDPGPSPSRSAPTVERIVCVMLGAGMVRTAFRLATPLHPMDFELPGPTTLFDRWWSLVKAIECASQHEVRVVLAPGASAPQSASARSGVVVVHDREGYRGPAGALRDACESDAPDTLLCVIEANRLFLEPVEPIVQAHLQSGCDVTVVAQGDRTPAGLTILRRRSLDSIPARGYMDMKEQWLDKCVAVGQSVRVHRISEAGSLGIRDRRTLLRAAARLAPPAPEAPANVRMRRIGQDDASWFAGRGFGGQDRAPDSWIMGGSQVDPRSLIARCVVFPSAQVASDERLVDMLVGPLGRINDEEFERAQRHGGRAT